MSRKYKFHNPTAAYFVSFATVYWIDVFTREDYFKIIANSLAFCRKEKGMELFAYCIMPSHLHLLFRSQNENPGGLLRDFKGFTSKNIVRAINENPQESRKEWMLWMFKKAGAKNSNVKEYQFWQQHNQPIELWSTPVIKQKLSYIHNNPIKSGFVKEAWEWKYSSARNYAEMDAVIAIDEVGFLG
ncbi:MAG TPA: transposase [Flavobacteriaceae bacterium]|nr:transposase [Flavobacteriaceae bacterium]